MKTPFRSATLAILRKDLRVETRSRELLSAMTIFALLCILVFSFALELNIIAREEAVSGVLWVSLIFASIIGFNRSLSLEHDHGNLEALLLAPIPRPAIFAGKLLGNYLFTLTIAFLILPLMTALYSINLLNAWLLLTATIGALGFSAIGTILAMLTIHTRSRETLLPIATLPIALPLLLTALRATNGILNATPTTHWQFWLQLCAAISAIYLTICWLLSDFLLGE